MLALDSSEKKPLEPSGGRVLHKGLIYRFAGHVNIFTVSRHLNSDEQSHGAVLLQYLCTESLVDISGG